MRMRFEVNAAGALGILLPGLETVRRGMQTWAVDFTTMFQDYVAGALLLTASLAIHYERKWGDLFLLVAWSYAAGLMSSSFWHQMEETLRGVAGEPGAVVFFKAFVWGVTVVAAVLSFRHLRRERTV